jgi:ribosomal subunit interface protein
VDITISRRGADTSEALQAAARRKMSHLARLVDGLEAAQVHFAEERNPRIADREICEVVLEGRGQRVQGKAAAPDPFGALERVVRKLEPQLSRLKGRAVRPHRG